MMTELLVIGSGGHARTILDIALLNNLDVVGVIDVNYQNKEETIMGIPVIGNMDQLDDYKTNETSVFVALGNNVEREEVIEKVTGLGYEIPILVHPTAIVSESVEIGFGTVICAGVILNPLVKIGRGVIINTGGIVDHESQIGDFVHLGPSVSVAGRVSVGKRSFVGIGSSIVDKVTIGKDTLIGAGTVVLKNVPDGSKVVGVSKILNK